MDEHDWLPFLEKWSREIAASPNHADKLPEDVIASGWLGFPGATEEEIEQAEDRLGVRLPPSYRTFLDATNGWRTTGTFIDRLWSVGEVEWFKVRNQEWIDAYTMYGDTEISDVEYFVYGEDQDSAFFRTEYLKTALEISDAGDSAILLLNPQVVTAEGEWEAWFFGNWLPGAARYRSFWDLMQAEYKSFRDLEEN
jgi:hypothetical protein